MAKDLQDADPLSNVNLAVAVYLGTYYDGSNSDSKTYYRENAEDENFLEFHKLQTAQKKKTQIEYQDYINKILQYDFFLNTCRKIESSYSNQKVNTIKKLVNIKKLFSIPWVICHEALFFNQVKN